MGYYHAFESELGRLSIPSLNLERGDALLDGCKSSCVEGLSMAMVSAKHETHMMRISECHRFMVDIDFNNMRALRFD